MAQAVKALPPKIHKLARVSIWDMRDAESRDRARALGVKSMPSIYVDGARVFADQIPGPDELAELVERMSGDADE